MNQTSKVIQHLRRAVLLQEGAGLTDGQLLGCFVEHRDEAAFAALVRRHGPLVWGVCRRLLNHHDAEDAFQAAFLVLFRKAASILPRELVANWLYGVAHQTALQARRTAVRRRAREKQVTEMPDAEAMHQDLWRDLRHLLDQELSCLPDKYRIAIVLCDLEGKTRKEAASQLGCPEGTVAGRLARARAMLAKRLARHGLGVSCSALAVVLSQNVASARAPTSVVFSTIQAANLWAAGPAVAGGVNSDKVATLAEGVLKSMSPNKLKIATLVLAVLVVAIVAASAGRLPGPTQAAEQPQPPKAEKPIAQEGGKPAADPKPVVVQEDAHVHRLAWSANGKILATVAVAYDLVKYKNGAGEDEGTVLPSSTVKIWDAKTGELKRSLGEEKYTWFTAIAFSPDKKTAAITVMKHPHDPPTGGGLSKTEVRLVDAQTWALKDKVDEDGTAWALAFSPDGTRLAIGGGSSAKDGSYVKVYDVRKDKLVGGQKGKGGGVAVTCLGFSHNGKMLAAGEQDGKVRLFDGLTGELSRELQGHGEWVTGVGFFPDGKTLVSGSTDKTVKLWDVESGKLERTLEGNKGPVTAFAFSQDRQLFATAGSFKEGMVEVLLWDAKTGTVKKALPDQTMDVRVLVFSPDGKTLALGGGNAFRLAPENGYGRLKTPGELKLWHLQ